MLVWAGLSAWAADWSTYKVSGLGSQSMKTGSENNIPRYSVPEHSTRNCKASYDLASVPSETSAGSRSPERAQVPEGAVSLPRNGSGEVT